MKKLMIAAIAAAAAGGAFATPIVYDYKASVKHMYLKEVRVNVAGFNGVVYQKFQKAASLKGYLIIDEDGAMSPQYNALATRATPGTTTTALDHGRNAGFLVVMNNSAERAVRAPKILPAVLDAKWFDTNFRQLHRASTGLAEGTLFVGGDTMAAVRPKLENPAGAHVEVATAGATPAANQAGFVALADYVWTSVYLFGQYNGPNWFRDPVTALTPFDNFEQAWDAALPTGVATYANAVTPKLATVVNYYHDTWMNGAGIGRYGTANAGDTCCGLTPTSDAIVATLSGSLKGGVFICTENGIDAHANTYTWWDGAAWEDQFACDRDETRSFTYNTDAWQNDLWQDGATEQETTDVIYGTWSIKYNSTYLTRLSRQLTPAETATIVPIAGTEALWACIKGAAVALTKNENYAIYPADGVLEIYNVPAGSRFAVPMVTPAFATYYGLK